MKEWMRVKWKTCGFYCGYVTFQLFLWGISIFFVLSSNTFLKLNDFADHISLNENNWDNCHLISWNCLEEDCCDNVFGFMSYKVQEYIYTSYTYCWSETDFNESSKLRLKTFHWMQIFWIFRSLFNDPILFMLWSVLILWHFRMKGMKEEVFRNSLVLLALFLSFTRIVLRFSSSKWDFCCLWVWNLMEGGKEEGGRENIRISLDDTRRKVHEFWNLIPLAIEIWSAWIKFMYFSFKVHCLIEYQLKLSSMKTGAQWKENVHV